MEESRTARIMRQIKEICEVAGVKTEEYAKVTKRQLNVVSLARELSREKAALGGRVFELSKRDDPGDVFGDVTAQAILGRIRDLEGTLSEYDEEIAEIHAAASARATDIRRKYDGPTPAGAEAAQEIEIVATAEVPSEEEPSGDDDVVDRPQ